MARFLLFGGVWGWVVGHKHIFINGDGVVGASSVPSIYGPHKTPNEGFQNQPSFHGNHGCLMKNHFIFHFFL